MHWSASSLNSSAYWRCAVVVTDADCSQHYQSLVLGLALTGCQEVLATGRASRQTLEELRIIIELELKEGVDLAAVTGKNAFKIKNVDYVTHEKLLWLFPDKVAYIQDLAGRPVPANYVGWQVSFFSSSVSAHASSSIHYHPLRRACHLRTKSMGSAPARSDDAAQVVLAG
jgi:hypothetical protein